MTLFFAWAAQDEIFDPMQHNREDEAVLNFHLAHQEGNFPYVELEVMALKSYQEGAHTKAFLSYGFEDGRVQLLFTGSIEDDFLQPLDGCFQLILWGKRPDAALQIQRHLENFKKLPQWEPLLVPAENRAEMDEILDNLTVLPHWDRCTGMLTFSDVLKGQETVPLNGDFFEDSLEVTENAPPYTHVNVKASAQWIQRYDGVVDMTPVFHKLGERGFISTLTPEPLQHAWWQKGYSLGNSGYKVIKSTLNLIQPPSTGELNFFPLQSHSFQTTDGEKSLMRYWFEPKLILQWNYRQKREETIELCVHLPDCKKKTEKQLSLRLENISLDNPLPFWKPYEWYIPSTQILYEGKIYKCTELHESKKDFEEKFWISEGEAPCALQDPSSATFFLTEHGQKVIEALIEKARAYIIGSLQRIKVYVELPFEKGLQLSCDKEVTLSDPRLPGGEISGKIKNYGLVAEGDQGSFYAYLTLGAIPDHLRDYSLIIGDGGGDKATASGIRFHLSSDQQPTEGIIHPATLAAEDFLVHINLENNINAQNEKLTEKPFQSERHAFQTLQKFPPRLRIVLRSLRGMETIKHTLFLDKQP